MGFLDDMKRLFWAKKSVAKSQSRKGMDEVKDFANESYDAVKSATDEITESVVGAIESEGTGFA